MPGIGRKSFVSLPHVNVNEAKTLVKKAYESGQVKAAWIARNLPGKPDPTTVRRWLSGKFEPHPSVWVQIYSVVATGVPLENPVAEDAFNLALTVLRDGATAEAKQLAAKIVAESRKGYTP